VRGLREHRLRAEDSGVSAFLVRAAVSAALCPAASLFWCMTLSLLRRRRLGFIEGWLASAAGGAAGGLILRDWAWGAGAAVSLAIALAVWWWRRSGRRKRATAWIGAKSKAVRDALVKRQREAVPRPRPVLRPAPGGVG
jgi:hypothetical protein